MQLSIKFDISGCIENSLPPCAEIAKIEMYGVEIRFQVTKLGNPPLQAAVRNFTSPRYTWILHGWYPNRWWTKEVANETIACMDEQLEMFLTKSRTLIVNNLPAPTDSDIETTAGIVSYESILCILYTLKFCGRHTVQASCIKNHEDILGRTLLGGLVPNYKYWVVPLMYTG